MTQPIIRVDGARQIRRAMRQAGLDLADMSDANRQVANVAGAAARSTTPRRSGNLASSVRVSGTKTQAIVRAGGASVPYAQAIHWGWPKRHIRAQPWISTAAQATEPAWFALYVAAVNRIIDKIGSATP